MGINDRDNPESWSTIKPVSEMVIHPLYEEENYKNDIALFKLEVIKLLIFFSCKKNQNFFNYKDTSYL